MQNFRGFARRPQWKQRRYAQKILNKAQATLPKKDIDTGVSKTFKNTYFIDHLQATASVTTAL